MKNKYYFWILLLLVAAVPARATDETSYQRISAIMHVHSLISPHGKVSLQAIVASAKKRGVDVLIPTDHFIERWEYGVPPLQGIIRTSVSRDSVSTFGPATYLHILNKLQQENPSLLIIPGLETSPAYYWTGHLFEANLTLHEPQRHMLVLGLTDANDIKNLPVLSNPAAGTVAWKNLVLPAVVVCVGLALMIRWPAGLLLVALGLLWGINQRPFRRLPPYYEQFTRNGYDAAQNVINYVESHGALAVWAHPEAPNWTEPQKLYRSVSMQTMPYPEAVTQTKNFTGFSYFWEGEKIIGPPGGLWDQALAAYAKGAREKPIWAFGELDWTEDHGEDFTLSSMENILWVKEKTVTAVMDAFRRGRFYLFRNAINNGMVLNQWTAGNGTNAAMSGEQIAWTPRCGLTVEATISARNESTRLEGEIIRNGEVWKKLEGNVHLRAQFSLPTPAGNQKDFYRLVLRGYGGEIVSNPIFVQK